MSSATSAVHSLSLKTRGELWLARGLHLFYSLWPRRLEDCTAPGFVLHDIPAAQGISPPAPLAEPPVPIPPIVWAYWNGAAPPALIQRCFDNWQRTNQGFSLRILNETIVLDYIPEIPAALDSASHAKRADWIRLELLRRYGGIWVDASSILTRSLDWVLTQYIRTPAEFMGFYLERHTRDAAYPVVENWFMAAPPGSRLIVDWQHEFTTEVIHRSGQEYIDHLKDKGVFETVRQHIDSPDYLSMHLALQYILHSRGGYRLALARAEDGPFRLHVLGRWGRTPLKLRLLFSRVTGDLPPLIKLRAPDRKRLDHYLDRGLYVHGSVAARYLVGE